MDSNGLCSPPLPLSLTSRRYSPDIDITTASGISPSTPPATTKKSFTNTQRAPSLTFTSPPPIAPGALHHAMTNAALFGPIDATKSPSALSATTSDGATSPGPSGSPSPTSGHRRQYSQPTCPRPVRESSHARLSVSIEDGSRILNGYRLTSVLGKGSFGAVQRAYDEQGRQVAVKEYSKSRLRHTNQKRMRGRRRPPMTSSQSAECGLELVRYEVAIMKKLSHPNICRLMEVIDTEEEEDSIFFVMDICQGGPVLVPELGKRVEPLSHADARHVIQQVVLGLEYLHFHEIIHHDIKPDNVLYVSAGTDRFRGDVKIVDFGGSELFATPGDDTVRKSSGSPAFLSPELCIASVGNHGKPADIWALGVTLFTLVFGYLPWQDTSVIALYDKIKDNPVELPEDADEDLKDLLKKLLIKDPQRRIVMAKLREHPWITEGGSNPLPSTHDNVTPIDEPTASEIANAFSVRAASTVLRAIQKFKSKLHHRNDTSSTIATTTNTSGFLSEGRPVVSSPQSSFTDSPKLSDQDHVAGLDSFTMAWEVERQSSVSSSGKKSEEVVDELEIKKLFV